MRRMLGRASFLIRRDLHLGNVLERLAAVHGDRRLVTESQGGLTLTHRQAAKRVARWAGGVAARTEPGDVVVVATPNGYEQLLLCLAVARAGCIPAPVNDAMRPDEVRHVVEDSGAAFVLRSAHAGRRTRAAPRGGGCQRQRRRCALLHLRHDRQAQGRGPHPRCPAGLPACRLRSSPPAPRAEAVVSLPVAHIMGFVTLLGLAATGTATWFSPRFRAAEVLDAIESRRAAVFIGVPAMYRLLLEAGAEDRDLRSIRVWGPAPTSCRPTWPAASRAWVPPSACPAWATSARPSSPRATASSRPAAGWRPRSARRSCASARATPWASRCPATACGSSTRTVARATAGPSGELLVKGPGVLRGYWHDEAATAAVLDDDGWLHTGDLARRGPARLDRLRRAGRRT